MGKLSDVDFEAAWKEGDGRARRVAEITGMSERSVYMRRAVIEKKTGRGMPSAGAGNGHDRGDAGMPAYNYNPRTKLDGFTGRVVSFSDCHWWPGISETLAYRALLEVIKEIKPKLIVGNGDLLDGARISRFGKQDWAPTPRLPDELEEVKARCAEIRHSHRSARLIRTIGNHDIRFDRWLASRVPDFEGIGGFRLSEHLKEWEETMAIWVNGHTVIKHRWHGGIHAAWNNVVKSGVTMVTGHTHDLEVKPYADYRGRRYGCQDGTLADPSGPQFAYAEDNPSRACSGFVTLNFVNGEVLQPQACEVKDGVAYYRDEVVLRERKRAA